MSCVWYNKIVTKGNKKMRMKRIHQIELARFYQRIENKHNEKTKAIKKPGLIKRLLNVK